MNFMNKQTFLIGILLLVDQQSNAIGFDQN